MFEQISIPRAQYNSNQRTFRIASLNHFDES